ncbi:hypothetical protein DFP72DRAFT_898225 [Ephemerocybe angulata]|uniref:Uncharacterized protein n=1 Tax=Ephemerocybe angulata TaxID=980116 RepID=A0A8H6HZ85_9AGAR|nr:hypothetical protein DFP72DRAFT_898225 [Tulosesus angulatus]
MDRLDAYFIGALLMQLFFGLYVAVFCFYLKIIRVRKSSLTIVDFATILLFILCLSAVVTDDMVYFLMLRREPGAAPWLAKLNATASSLSVVADFVSQMVVIYRCWQVFGRRLSVGVVPTLCASASLITGLCVTGGQGTPPTAGFTGKIWWIPLGIPSMAISLAVNALVSILMILRIYLVHRRSKSFGFSMQGSKLLWTASVLVEAALFQFAAQLVLVVLFTMDHPAFSLMVGPVTIIYGLNCTAIVARIGMNRSFEESVVEGVGAVSSIRFGGKSTKGYSESSGVQTKQEDSVV